MSGEYKLECWGSQGGTTVENGIPGKGGYCIGAYSTKKNGILYICIGNCGSFGTHSYNNNPGLELIGGFPGGGATHISIKNGGELITFKTHKEDVLIVAGAGGSCDLDSYISGCGGYGGGATLAGSGGGGSSYGNNLLLVSDSYHTIDGAHEMPSPSGGTEIGHSGDGACVISWFLK